MLEDNATHRGLHNALVKTGDVALWALLLGSTTDAELDLVEVRIHVRSGRATGGDELAVRTSRTCGGLDAFRHQVVLVGRR